LQLSTPENVSNFLGVKHTYLRDADHVLTVHWGQCEYAKLVVSRLTEELKMPKLTNRSVPGYKTEVCVGG